MLFLTVANFHLAKAYAKISQTLTADRFRYKFSPILDFIYRVSVYLYWGGILLQWCCYVGLYDLYDLCQLKLRVKFNVNRIHPNADFSPYDILARR